jgi:hypothetical protein
VAEVWPLEWAPIPGSGQRRGWRAHPAPEAVYLVRSYAAGVWRADRWAFDGVHALGAAATEAEAKELCRRDWAGRGGAVRRAPAARRRR